MSFLAEAEQEGPVALVLLTPQRPGEWLDALGASLRTRRGTVRAIVGVDGIGGSSRSFLRRVFFRDPQDVDSGSAEELAEVEARLHYYINEVFLADRRTGAIEQTPRAPGRSRAA